MEERFKVDFNDIRGKTSHKSIILDGKEKLKSIQETLSKFSGKKFPDDHLFIFPGIKSTLPKLVDATWAGTTASSLCTLIVCEGESAKSTIVGGISSLPPKDRCKFGILPFTGTILNPCDSKVSNIVRNVEVQNLICALGLDEGNFRGFDSLRYQKIMIMSDQDDDGFHFKGLFVNLFYNLWPALVKKDGFLAYFNMPIVTTCEKAGKDPASPFYFQKNFEDWCKDKEDLGLYDIKYYKGLASFTNQQAIRYFERLELNRIAFNWEGEEDRAAIRLAFEKNWVEKRKEWMKKFKPEPYFEEKNKKTSYSMFFNKQYINYALAAKRRAIPSIVDGLKPSQRKVLYAAFKKNQWEEIRVDQFTGSVSEVSSYHHSDASLALTIILMAQDFAGSNNLNLLEPIGQFGSCRNGGKDHASPRSIWTKLNDVNRHLFNEEDNYLLNYLIEDGLFVEPRRYYPIIPLVLVNRCRGTGFGYSTRIPNYSPIDIIKVMQAMLLEKETPKLIPHYKGFNGKIVETPEKDGFYTYGKVSCIVPNSFEIVELPINVWTEKFKDKLAKQLVEFHETGGDVMGNTTLVVKLRVGHPLFDKNPLTEDDIIKHFELRSKIGTTNMYLHDFDGEIRSFDNIEQIVQVFFVGRLKVYKERRTCMKKRLTEAKDMLVSKVKFTKAMTDNTSRTKFSAMSNEKKLNWFKSQKYYAKKGDGEISIKSFEYLTSLLNKSALDDLVDLRNKTKAAYDLVEGIPTEKKMWLDDLENLLSVLLRLNIS